MARKERVVPFTSLEYAPSVAQHDGCKGDPSEQGYLLVELLPQQQLALQKARHVLSAYFQSVGPADKACLMKPAADTAGTAFAWIGGKQQLDVYLHDGSPATATLLTQLGPEGSTSLQQAVLTLDEIARKVVKGLLPEATDADYLLEASTLHPAGHQQEEQPQQPQLPSGCAMSSFLQASWYTAPPPPSSHGVPPAAYDWGLDKGLVTVICEDVPCTQVMGRVQPTSDSGGAAAAGALPIGPSLVAVLAGYTLQRAWGVRRACWHRAVPHTGPAPHLCLAYRLRARPDALLCPGRIRQVSVREVYQEFAASTQQHTTRVAALEAQAPLVTPTTSAPHPGPLATAPCGEVPPPAATDLRMLSLSEGPTSSSSGGHLPTSPVDTRLCSTLNFQLFVHNAVDRRTRKYEVHPLTTVGQLRAVMQSRMGARRASAAPYLVQPPQQQQRQQQQQQQAQGPPAVLVYAGRQMEDSRRLLDYGILPEATIHMVAPPVQ